MTFVTPVEVRFADVDGLGHVNNAVYLSFLEQARMRFFTGSGADTERDFPFILAHAAIDYRRPMRLDAAAEVCMWTARVGGKSWDFEYDVRDKKTGDVYATAKTVQVAYDYEIEKSQELEGNLRDLVKSLARS